MATAATYCCVAFCALVLVLFVLNDVETFISLRVSLSVERLQGNGRRHAVDLVITAHSSSSLPLVAAATARSSPASPHFNIRDSER